ncbi:monovalent cation:proton antiporter-2 (CPA2) family protein [Massilia sp. CFBP9026]|uniref:monovalent cation:proton antiporter-2 (CPA2) family protein n=1 Tax=Massilia sp. CFBP9026 TaxID=3096536 RepID=UPI002A6B0627|nr:monovalent cation:proton antiporter-2 (CPA2) family protein [Massilia sp. CFBP9026]MDY0961099.1 monovalent cation:proton antiporter-2 (CPA2) family protein [Massilia sp. CFBP9026]
MSAPAAGHTQAAPVELLPILMLLGAAVLAVPLFKRLGLGSVTGYLAAGMIVGPFGLQVIADPQAILHVAELGVVMFLFVIGLEMQPSRLWTMRGEIFGLGFAQVAGASALLTAFGMVLGFPFAQSFVGGTGFVLTSTAIVMQMLEERRVRGLPRGRRTIAILLLEDLAIVPLLAAVALLAPDTERIAGRERIEALGIGAASIAGLVLAGRYLLDPLFRILGQARAREVMTAAALLVVLGAAYAMQLGGLSMAMGAFLAGVLLSESTFRHQLEADIEPFRGILLGLFFLGVGMALDLGVIVSGWQQVALAVAGYMLLKMAVIYGVARMFDLDNREAVGRAVLMAQGGEFAFVLYAAATAAGILDARQNAILTTAVIVSMILTPFLIMLYDAFMPKWAPSTASVTPPSDLSANVLLIGFGRFGQIASQPLLENGYSLSIIETSTQAIFDLEPLGFKVHYGDGTRLDILQAAGAMEARLIVVAIDDRQACLRIVEIARAEFPHTPVLARAFDREHALELIRLGVDWQVRETFESALTLAGKALELLEPDARVRDAVMDAVRRRDAERLAIQVTEGLYAAPGLIRNNAQGRER